MIDVKVWWLQAREVMDAMQKDADFSQVQLLKVDGGASNNNLLMQMQADALQVSSKYAPARHCTACEPKPVAKLRRLEAVSNGLRHCFLVCKLQHQQLLSIEG